MRYGHFDDRKREYVIERPDTPLPWINYLGSQAYFGLISNTAGGYSFYKDARLRRITRYRYNNAPLDCSGRYIYIRDDGAKTSQADPLFWSPSWQPTRIPLDTYECRHGMGYTVIHSELAEIEASTLYFVPISGDNGLSHLVAGFKAAGAAIQTWQLESLLENDIADLFYIIQQGNGKVLPRADDTYLQSVKEGLCLGLVSKANDLRIGLLILEAFNDGYIRSEKGEGPFQWQCPLE